MSKQSLNKRLGLAIREARKNKNLSQSQLGRLVRPPMSQSRVGDIETGKHAASIGAYGNVCKALGVKLGVMLNRADKPNKKNNDKL